MNDMELQSLSAQIKVEQQPVDIKDHMEKGTNPFIPFLETFPGLNSPLIRNNKIVTWPGAERISDSVQEGKVIVQIEAATKVSFILQSDKVPAKLKHFALLFLCYRQDNVDEIVVLSSHRGLFLSDIFNGYSAGIKTRESFMTDVYGVNHQPYVARLCRVVPASNQNHDKIFDTTLSLVRHNLANNILQYFIL